MATDTAPAPEYPRHDGFCPVCGQAIEPDGLLPMKYETAEWGCHECAAIWDNLGD